MAISKPPTVRRRRRGAALEDAIHGAVFAELAEVGYASVTIEAVAIRAKTGKASIYRRWSTKAELVVDSFVARFAGLSEVVGELIADAHATTRDVLVLLSIRIWQMLGGCAEVVCAVACECARDLDLAATVEQKVHSPGRAALVELLRRGVDRGEVRPAAVCDLYADALPAQLTYRMVLNNQLVTERDAVDIVDHLVMPLVAMHG
jgi:AcrR family transcriptional regulator